MAAAPAAAAAKEEPAAKRAGGIDALETLVDQVHGAAKWFVGAFAGVGALLIPGLQLTQLGAVGDLDLVLALVWMLVGAAAAVVAATSVATLVAADRPTVAELASRERGGSPDDPLVTYFRDNPSIFLGEVTGLGDLLDELGAARGELRAAREEEHALGPVTDAATEDEKEKIGEAFKQRRAAESRVRVLDQIRAAVEAVARFQQQRRGLVDRRGLIVGCTVVIAAAMALFAIQVNPAVKSTADFSGATVTGVDFNGANLGGADFGGARLVDVSFEGTELDAGSLEGARMTRVTCPDGTPAKDGCG